MLFLLILFSIVVISWFALSQYKKSYELLPAALPKKLEAPANKDWREFTPRSQKFSVLLPVLPQHASENQADRHYEMYVSEKNDGTLFMISLINFKNPIDTKHHEVVLNSIMEDLLNSNPTNELKSSNNDTYENRKALDFTIENKEIVINGKAFMDDQTLYVLTRISKLNQQDKKEFDFFIHSFHLLPTKNQKSGVKSE